MKKLALVPVMFAPALVMTGCGGEEKAAEVKDSGATVKQQVVFDLQADLFKGGILTVEAYDDNYDTVYADFDV